MEFKNMLIKEDITILQTMEKMEETAKKVLFIEEDGKLLAAVTDGDIRRWILSGGELSAPVSRTANYAPKYLFQDERSKARSYMKKHMIEALPLLDENHRIVAILFWNEAELLKPMQKVQLPVVIMAGGLGTRLYPYTKILPKPLIPIGDIPIAEHIIHQFYAAGCRDFYLIVNHKKNMIKAYFNEIEKDYHVSYAEEKEPLGTGGGLSLLKGKIQTTFILTNCDILIQEDFGKIYKYHREQGNVITMVCSLKNFRIPYGIVEISEEGGIQEMKEKPTLSFFTNTGCYFVEPEVIADMKENTAIGFPDIIEKYKKQGKKVGVYPISEKSWLDMGQMDEMEKMKERLGVQ